MSRFAVAVGARLARSAWKRLPKEDQNLIVNKLKSRRRVWISAGAIGISAGAYYYYSHLNYTPLTDRRRFMTYNREDIRRLLSLDNPDSDYIYNMINPEDILPSDHPDYKLCKGIMMNILRSNMWCDELKDIKSWRLIVINSDDVNAFSLPTGDIVVCAGMIRQCRNMDELGLIMGHELAHVVLNHGCEGLSRNGLVSFLGLFVIAGIWFFIPSDFLSFFIHHSFNTSVQVLVDNPYSQKLELEADRVGLMLASKACYNPDQSIQVWNDLPELGGHTQYSGTHPCNKKRLDMMTSLLPSALTLYNDSSCVSTFTKFTKSVTNTLKKYI